MLQTFPSVRESHTARLLAAFGARRLLRSLRLTRRSDLVQACSEKLRALELVKLYIDIFHEVPPGDDMTDPWGISYSLAGRVHQERFPLSLSVMDDFANSEENPIYYDIMVEGSGIYWEGQGISRVPEAIRPLVAFWVLSGHMDFDPEGEESEDDLLQSIADWMDTLDSFSLPAGGPDFIWPITPGGLTAMIKRLEALPPPLDGLAAALRCVAKDNANPFLDIPDCHYYYYEEFWGVTWSFPWTAENIEKLTKLYQEAVPHIRKRNRLVAWVGCSSRRMHEITATLIECGLEINAELNETLSNRPKTLVELFGNQEEE